MPDREQFRADTEQILEAHRAEIVSAEELKRLRLNDARYCWLRSINAFDVSAPQPPADTDWWGDLGDAINEDFDARIDRAMRA